MLKWTDDFEHTLWAKKFGQIALSATNSDINVFLCFTQIFTMATQHFEHFENGQKWVSFLTQITTKYC